ncbi:putative ribonuclease H-like domain-containing protein [Tanacetum coccineum]
MESNSVGLILKRPSWSLWKLCGSVHNGIYALVVLLRCKEIDLGWDQKWYHSLALRNFDLEDMELESTNSGPTAKLPILKLGEYEMWAMRIKQYFQIEKIKRKNDVKARGLLLMALPNITSANIHWIETMGSFIDDLDNNFKVFEQKIKKIVGTSSGGQNLAFMNAPSSSSINDANTAYSQVSAASPSVNTASPQVCTTRKKNNLEGKEGSEEDEKEEKKRKNPLCQRIVTVEAQLVTYRKNEVLFSEEVAVLKREVEFKQYEINTLKAEFEKLKQEKDAIDFKIEKFDKASKDLDQLPKKLDLSYSGLDEFKEPKFKGYGLENSKKESNIVKESENSKENYDKSLVKELESQVKSRFVKGCGCNTRNDELIKLNAEKKTVTLLLPKIVNPVRKSVLGKEQLMIRICCQWGVVMAHDCEANTEAACKFSKVLNPITKPLFMLHMDLFGPTGDINFKNINKLVKDNLAEAVSTACYVQNRVLVVKPHNKTPYELFRGLKPALSFMRPFGCHVTILNTLDNLGKFDGKSDEGFFVGYSLSSKAFRVYNTRTKRVEENLHIGFLENKPMIEGNGPKWLFDIDSLTQSMNYVPVAAGTITNESAGKITNESAGTQGELNAGTSTQKEESSQDCIVMPIWKDASYFDSPSKDVGNANPKSTADDQKQVEDGPDNENDEKYKFEDDSSPK